VHYLKKFLAAYPAAASQPELSEADWTGPEEFDLACRDLDRLPKAAAGHCLTLSTMAPLIQEKLRSWQKIRPFSKGVKRQRGKKTNRHGQAACRPGPGFS
jgi:hypothetical protein